MGALFDLVRSRSRKFLQLSFGALIVLSTASIAQGQEYHGKWNFNIGGGVGFPQGELSNFADSGGNFVVGGGRNFNRFVGLNGEWMWHDLPINSSTKQALQTPDASARQYALTFDPTVRAPLGHHLGAYAIGGIGWYHRSGETSTPGLAVICDPYWSGGMAAASERFRSSPVAPAPTHLERISAVASLTG